MEKTHDFVIKPKSADRSSADRDFNNETSLDATSFAPPTFQLKVGDDKGEEQEEKSAIPESTYQLAAEGIATPPNTPNENINNQSTPDISVIPIQFKSESKTNTGEEKEEKASLPEPSFQLAAEGIGPPPDTPNDGAADQSKPNNTGLPTQLKSGVESLSGFSLDDVKVHYNSDKPAQLKAHAYAQGTDIHVASGQERHLPHEAWHVVQQKQGRVQPTTQLKTVNINDDDGLEREADEMGAKALNQIEPSQLKSKSPSSIPNQSSDSSIIQAKKSGPFDVPKRIPAKIDIKYSEYKDLDDQEYQDFMFEKLEAEYNNCLAKGTRYWNKLQAATQKFQGEESGELLNSLAEKRASYDERFKNNYETTSEHNDSRKFKEVKTHGLGYDGDQVDPKADIPYLNRADFRDNSIHGIHNYAERDNAREADVMMGGAEDYETRGLPNSEIIWQQYKTAAKTQFWFKKDEKAAALMRGLNAVRRRQVQPRQTLMTILFAMPDNKIDIDAVHTWYAGSEEFLALCGTPNVSGILFMLADHIDQLDKITISEIRLLGGKDVNLDIILG